MLKFSKGNAKLKNIISFSIISGWSCPFADKCLSKVDLKTGKISDGKNTEFRCFSASQESLYPAVREQRLWNFEQLKKLKTVEEISKKIQQSLPKVNKNGLGKIVRLHVAGDFFNQMYFDAWLNVATNNPDRTFYAYTKSLQYWVNRLGQIPANFKLNASKGGKQDELIELYNLKYAEVVYSEIEAKEKGLEIDHDDSHAYDFDHPFALLIHGVQPKGSKASKAKSTLAKEGWTGYKKKSGRGKVINS
ncbi:MAG: hypothetical protein RLZ10_208 [Bacteroidota bacterium]|jgi:hypothetical protein